MVKKKNIINLMIKWVNKMNDCLFCKIVKGEINSEKVFEDDNILAFMDINPVNKGHVLVVTKNIMKLLMIFQEIC